MYLCFCFLNSGIIHYDAKRFARKREKLQKRVWVHLHSARVSYTVFPTCLHKVRLCECIRVRNMPLLHTLRRACEEVTEHAKMNIRVCARTLLYIPARSYIFPYALIHFRMLYSAYKYDLANANASPMHFTLT